MASQPTYLFNSQPYTESIMVSCDGCSNTSWRVLEVVCIPQKSQGFTRNHKAPLSDFNDFTALSDSCCIHLGMMPMISVLPKLFMAPVWMPILRRFGQVTHTVPIWWQNFLPVWTMILAVWGGWLGRHPFSIQVQILVVEDSHFYALNDKHLICATQKDRITWNICTGKYSSSMNI